MLCSRVIRPHVCPAGFHTVFYTEGLKEKSVSMKLPQHWATKLERFFILISDS